MEMRGEDVCSTDALLTASESARLRFFDGLFVRLVSVGLAVSTALERGGELSLSFELLAEHVGSTWATSMKEKLQNAYVDGPGVDVRKGCVGGAVRE